MVQRVNLDAMIPREDFGRQDNEDISVDLITDFPISQLENGSPIQKQLRKPDFQRETNHWSPEQVVTFIESFVDKEVIPGLIFWKSKSFIFVLDGGHRLSALRAWMEDDYGDRTISQNFYKSEIGETQLRIAKRTRALVEKRVGRYSNLKTLVGNKNVGDAVEAKRAGNLFTRPLKLQWVVGSPQIAESSFFKINSQGTPLDDVETMLIQSRNKPVAIGARAIVRAGQGHKYWSKFDALTQSNIEEVSGQIFRLLFKPEIDTPLRALDIPIGGSASPVDALSVVIEYLLYSANKPGSKPKQITEFDDDDTGGETLRILNDALKVTDRISGNSPGSLGLFPAVYFYNENAKHSRFLFLGMAVLISEKLKNNDSGWFRKFSLARENVEKFLIEEKSLIGMVLQNMAKSQRIAKMRDLFAFLVAEHSAGRDVTAEAAFQFLGVGGRILDGGLARAGKEISDFTKSKVFLKQMIDSAQICPICRGRLDTTKSMSYDHRNPISNGGRGDPANVDLVHPYCNTSIKGSSVTKEKKGVGKSIARKRII